MNNIVPTVLIVVIVSLLLHPPDDQYPPDGQFVFRLTGGRRCLRGVHLVSICQFDLNRKTPVQQHTNSTSWCGHWRHTSTSIHQTHFLIAWARSHLLVSGCNNGIPMWSRLLAFLVNLCPRSIGLTFIESVRVGRETGRGMTNQRRARRGGAGAGNMLADLWPRRSQWTAIISSDTVIYFGWKLTPHGLIVLASVWSPRRLSGNLEVEAFRMRLTLTHYKRFFINLEGLACQ